jgi:mRNA deadenylase 3'-5' endonuclease subunit Ccr4
MSFKLVSYNILYDGYPTGYSPSGSKGPGAWPWSNRRHDVIGNIEQVCPDVICVQECSQAAFTDLQKQFSIDSACQGFHQQHNNRQEGVAIFFNSRSLTQIHSHSYYISKEGKVGLIADLQHIASGKIFRIATSHFTGGPKRETGNEE